MATTFRRSSRRGRRVALDLFLDLHPAIVVVVVAVVVVLLVLNVERRSFLHSGNDGNRSVAKKQSDVDVGCAESLAASVLGCEVGWIPGGGGGGGGEGFQAVPTARSSTHSLQR